MSSPSGSGTSSGSSFLQNSCSDEDFQQQMDQRRLKRKQSNRESARRSRMRKQKHLDDLTAQVAHLTNENNRVLTCLNITSQHFMRVEAENSVLQTQIMELSNRLQSLNDILQVLHGTIHHHNNPPPAFAFDFGDPQDHIIDSFMRPWDMNYLNQQPIMASADMLQY
ncbi:hypothetical protein ACLOJK_001853 [Asimina triloba]